MKLNMSPPLVKKKILIRASLSASALRSVKYLQAVHVFLYTRVVLTDKSILYLTSPVLRVLSSLSCRYNDSFVSTLDYHFTTLKSLFHIVFKYILMLFRDNSSHP